MIKDIKIPEISENVTSGTVVSVLVKAGDWVEADDPVLEVETDKAVVEIPTPYKGRISEILAAEGDEVKIGDVIARVDTDADKSTESSEKRAPEATAPEPAKAEAAEPEKTTEADATAAAAAQVKKPQPEPIRESRPEAAPAPGRGPAPASPSVRRLARELGVDIHAVEPAGPGERITEADVKAHVRQAAPSAPPVARPAAAGEPGLPDFSRWGEVETVDLSTVRRITARSVSVSWQTVPHVTQFDRADVTALQEFIGKYSGRVAAAGGKLTVTAVLMKVCAAALRRFPLFNASIDPANNRLILKHYVHIGVMVDTPKGLLVPVVRDADARSITDLAIAIADLAERARNRKVKPDEMEGGTFSISNQGGIGGTNFTPIVLWPQAAILGVSRTAVEPRYMDGEFRPRSILPLSLSYDHRLIDGADAARFLRWVCESLEYPMAMHLE